MAKSPADRPVLSGAPRSFQAERQIDGNPTTRLEAAPPRYSQGGPRPLADRPAVPDRGSDSGMERAMAQHADQLHPTPSDRR